MSKFTFFAKTNPLRLFSFSLLDLVKIISIKDRKGPEILLPSESRSSVLCAVNLVARRVQALAMIKSEGRIQMCHSEYKTPTIRLKFSALLSRYVQLHKTLSSNTLTRYIPYCSVNKIKSSSVCSCAVENVHTVAHTHN